MASCYFYFDLSALTNVYGYDKALSLLPPFHESISALNPRGKWHDEIYMTIHQSVKIAVESSTKFLNLCAKKNTERSIPLVLRGGVCVDHKYSGTYYPSHGTMVDILSDWSCHPSLYVITDSNLKIPTIRYCFKDHGKLVTGSFLNSSFESAACRKLNKTFYRPDSCVLLAIDVDGDVLNIPPIDGVFTMTAYTETRYLIVLENLPQSTINKLLMMCCRWPCALRHGRNIIYHRDAVVHDSTAVKDVKNMLQLCIDLKYRMLMSQIIAHEISEQCKENVLVYNEKIYYNYHCIYSFKGPSTHTRLSNHAEDAAITEVSEKLDYFASTLDSKLDTVITLMTKPCNNVVEKKKFHQRCARSIEPLNFD